MCYGWCNSDSLNRIHLMYILIFAILEHFLGKYFEGTFENAVKVTCYEENWKQFTEKKSKVWNWIEYTDYLTTRHYILLFHSGEVICGFPLTIWFDQSTQVMPHSFATKTESIEKLIFSYKKSKKVREDWMHKIELTVKIAMRIIKPCT